MFLFMRMEQQQVTIGDVLSVIAYLRNFFAEEAFATTESGGVQMKTLRATKETTQFLGWVEAIQRRIDEVERVVLGVYGVGAKHRVLYEAYSIDVRRIGDIRRICVILQRMKILKKRVSIRMKVFSKKPISLPGFRTASGEDRWALSGSGRSVAEGLCVYRKGDTIQKSVMPYRAPHKIEGRDNTSTEPKKGESIRCACLLHETDGDMIQCDVCGNWLHTICCGFFSNQDSRVPVFFRCAFCCGVPSVGQRNLCLYRRSLGVVYGGEGHGIDFLHRRLSIPRSVSRALVLRLVADGFLQGRKGGPYNVTKDARAKEKVKEYFSSSKLECSISIEEIEINAPNQ